MIIMPTYMTVGILLLDGPEKEVTTEVRTAVYDALLYSMRHDNRAYFNGRLEDIVSFIFRGMKDDSRDVRRSSG